MTSEHILSTLRDLKASYKRDDLLLPILERHVVRASVDPDDRRTDIMHPSDMSKSMWCHRRDYYRISGEPSNYKESPDTFRRANQYDYGHHIHQKYQQWLWDIGILYGAFLCQDCGQYWWEQSPKVCVRCGSERLVYREVPLEYPDLHIGGHADGIVFLKKLTEQAYEALLLEIKSLGINSLRYEAFPLWEKAQQEQLTPEEIWFLIKRPFASHLRQGTMYLYLARLLYPDMHIDRIIFLYEWKPTQEVKEFVVEYNESFIAGVLESVDAVNAALDDDEPPERPEWAAVDAKGCEHCGYRSTCWGVSASSATTPSLRVKRASITARRRVVGA